MKTFESPWVKVRKTIKQDNRRTRGLSLCKNNENKQTFEMPCSFKPSILIETKSVVDTEFLE